MGSRASRNARRSTLTREEQEGASFPKPSDVLFRSVQTSPFLRQENPGTRDSAAALPASTLHSIPGIPPSGWPYPGMWGSCPLGLLCRRQTRGSIRLFTPRPQ